jgi:hypothetical protein
LALLAGHAPAAGVAVVFAPALFVMGAGSGAVITPNQALTLMEVDPVTGSTAGGVLQTGQRIGLAVGQAVIGAVFFAALAGSGTTAERYGHALRAAVVAALGFVVLAAVVGAADLLQSRRHSGRITASRRRQSE